MTRLFKMVLFRHWNSTILNNMLPFVLPNLSMRYRHKHTQKKNSMQTLKKFEQVIICKHGKVGEDRYLDPRSKKTFKFDHVRLVRREKKKTCVLYKAVADYVY
jgi:hypothetical protein